MLSLVTAAIPILGKVIDRVLPDDEAKAKAHLELLKLQQDGEFRELEAAARVIEAEAKSEHWLAATWRPITMLVFVALITGYWFGLTPDSLPESSVEWMFKALQVGLGGYMVGRSAEKIAKTWKGKD